MNLGNSIFDKVSLYLYIWYIKQMQHSTLEVIKRGVLCYTNDL